MVTVQSVGRPWLEFLPSGEQNVREDIFDTGGGCKQAHAGNRVATAPFFQAALGETR